MIDEFKISLPVVAALLTIIGYSLNDTIVVFDRIREVKGKSPLFDVEDHQQQHQSDSEPNGVDVVNHVAGRRHPVLPSADREFTRSRSP